MTLLLHRDILWIDDVNEIRLFVASTSEFRAINETGADIWRLVSQGMTTAEIVDSLMRQYGATAPSERETVEADTRNFISQLLHDGLIVESEAITSDQV